MTTELTGHAKCPKCQADLADLVIGGVGDWRTKILCKRCFHVQSGLNHRQVIVPLAAIQYGASEAAIAEADQRSQAEYEQVALGGPPFDDLPAFGMATRWTLRRQAVARGRQG